MEVTRSSLLCGTKQKCPIAHSLRVPPFFIISNTTLCLSSQLPLSNLFYLSIFPSNLTHCVHDKLFSHPQSPLDGLFRFLMSLYLALLERRDVSFYPEQHFSCHLGHFPPSATLGFCLICISQHSLSPSIVTFKRFIMTYMHQKREWGPNKLVSKITTSFFHQELLLLLL